MIDLDKLSIVSPDGKSLMIGEIINRTGENVPEKFEMCGVRSIISMTMPTPQGVAISLVITFVPGMLEPPDMWFYNVKMVCHCLDLPKSSYDNIAALLKKCIADETSARVDQIGLVDPNTVS